MCLKLQREIGNDDIFGSEQVYRHGQYTIEKQFKEDSVECDPDEWLKMLLLILSFDTKEASFGTKSEHEVAKLLECLKVTDIAFDKCIHSYRSTEETIHDGIKLVLEENDMQRNDLTAQELLKRTCERAEKGKTANDDFEFRCPDCERENAIASIVCRKFPKFTKAPRILLCSVCLFVLDILGVLHNKCTILQINRFSTRIVGNKVRQRIYKNAQQQDEIRQVLSQTARTFKNSTSVWLDDVLQFEYEEDDTKRIKLYKLASYLVGTLGIPVLTLCCFCSDAFWN